MDLERRMRTAQGLDRRAIKRAITLDARATVTPLPPRSEAPRAVSFRPMPALPDSQDTVVCFQS